MLSGKIIVLYSFIWAALLCTFLAIWIKSFRRWLTTNITLLITMLLGGLWHGASWQFVIWGGLNGLGIVFYKLWRKISPYEKYNNFFVLALKVLITLNFITFTRIWFRAESMEATGQILTQISTSFNAALIPQILSSYSIVFVVMLLGYIIHWLPIKVKDWYMETFIKLPLVIKISISAFTVFGIYQAMSSDFQAFIYFQF